MSVREFELQLDREWAEKIDDIEGWLIEVATEALASVVEKSPVDTGQFQNSWVVSIGSPDTTSTSGNGAAIIASYQGTEAGFPVIYLQNNLPYALRLENGWSSQAPSGVVGVTVTELQARFDGDQL